MSVGGDTRPFREKYPGYATVFPGTLASHYKQVLGTVKKNTTQPKQTDATRSHYGDIGYWGMLAGESGTGCPASVNFFTDSNNFLDPNTGKSTTPAALRYVYNCGNCYNGITDPIRLQDNANTFSACDALLAVTVTNGGTGYTDGDVLTITGAYPETINGTLQVATFRVKVTAGVIQSATVITSGCYSGIGANALTAQTTATGGTGTGATFTFTRKDAVNDFGRCNIVGWAAAAAARQWHGTFGFLDSCYTCPTDNTQGNPPQTKYLKVTWETYSGAFYYGGTNIAAPPISFDGTVPTVTNTFTGDGDYQAYGLVHKAESHASGSNTVDGNSGVIEYAVNLNTTAQIYNNHVGWDNAVVAQNGLLMNNDGSGPSLDGGNTIGYPGSYDMDGVTFYDAATSFPACSPPEVLDCYSTDGGDTWVNGTPSFDANYWNDADVSQLIYQCSAGTMTNDEYKYTSFTFTCQFPGNYLPDPSIINWGSQLLQYASGTITLSDSNTPAGVDSDSNENLLSPWVLVDPVMMPLTTQPFDGTVVKVSRNEVGMNVSPANYMPLWIAGVPLVGGLPQVYIDPNLAALTAGGLTAGQILGLPLDKTIGGDYPLDYFMPDYIRYICEDCSGGGTSSWDEYTIGDWRSNHAYLPPRATQWTNTREALFINTGRKQFIKGWVGTETGDTNICTTNASDKIWSTKWIETSVRLPSVNHARPFGLDRLVKDPAHQICDGDSAVCDPAWNSGDCTRWSNVPPMAGRLRITSITDNGDGTVTVNHDAMPVENVADAHNPVYNVDLSDKTMTPLTGAKNLVPSSVTTTSFIATATFANVKDAVWLTIYGAIPTADTSPSPPAEVAPWYWNDDRGKGNYWIGQWFYENQVYSDAVAVEYQKGFVYCSPYAIVLSSNATDTPTGVNYAGVRYDFSTPFIADEFCASARWMDVCQMMTDPYWNAPLCCPSVSSHPANSYPYVEARLIMPGAHAQPDNGAGMAQTESAPSGGNHINYTVDLSAATGLGSTPPIANTIFSQPACVLAPTGVYIAQPDTYCSP